MNNSEAEKIEILRLQIAELESRLADLHARLPAHSIPPGMVAEMDALDEMLEQAQVQLTTLNSIAWRNKLGDN